MGPRKSPTSTYEFGASRRESHDASAFYARFTPPLISDDQTVNEPAAVDTIVCSDAREMSDVASNSVALVVTSPPYFAGKEYEAELESGKSPATYVEYLAMLEDVFAECIRVLEPGGRIAVNVANLGRKPYRSLSADVTAILQDRLKLLLRGEIVWQKARGSTGSCAWGTFQRPANPVLRDMTERVIVAAKGRFDRAISAKRRHAAGLPSESSMSRDEFMEATTDLWEIPPESATRVGHPAPFPVALPERLIHLYTYYGDLVLDPFMGSGTTAIAALRTGRHYVGYDTDPAYVARAKSRIEEERIARSRPEPIATSRPKFMIAADASEAEAHDGSAAALQDGQAAKRVAKEMLRETGFSCIREDSRAAPGVQVTFSAEDGHGNHWYFEVCGGFTSTRPGLMRGEFLWRALGKACVIHEFDPSAGFVVMTTGVPSSRSRQGQMIQATTGDERPLRAVVDMSSSSAIAELHALLEGVSSNEPATAAEA